MANAGSHLFRASRRRGAGAGAVAANDQNVAEAHRKLQRAYLERASVGDRPPSPPIG